MRDYRNRDDDKPFILNYTKYNSEIIINFASGKSYTIPYSIENEKRTLNRMKEQVINAHEFYYEQKERFLNSTLKLVADTLLIGLNTWAIETNNTKSPTINRILIVMLTLNMIVQIYNIIDSRKNKIDYDKNQLFLENEEMINKGLRENDKNLSNINEYYKLKFKTTPKDEILPLTINDLDDLKYEELQTIIDNISFEKEMNYDYVSEDSISYKKLRKI